MKQALSAIREWALQVFSVDKDELLELAIEDARAYQMAYEREKERADRAERKVGKLVIAIQSGNPARMHYEIQPFSIPSKTEHTSSEQQKASA